MGGRILPSARQRSSRTSRYVARHSNAYKGNNQTDSHYAEPLHEVSQADQSAQHYASGTGAKHFAPGGGGASSEGSSAVEVVGRKVDSVTFSVQSGRFAECLDFHFQKRRVSPGNGATSGVM